MGSYAPRLLAVTQTSSCYPDKCQIGSRRVGDHGQRLAGGSLRHGYLELGHGPERERPGSTRMDYPLGHDDVFQGGWGFLGLLSHRGWGLSLPGPRRSRGQSAVFCTIVALLREERDSVLARWTARARHPGAT